MNGKKEEKTMGPYKAQASNRTVKKAVNFDRIPLSIRVCQKEVLMILSDLLTQCKQRYKSSEIKTLKSKCI